MNNRLLQDRNDFLCCCRCFHFWKYSPQALTSLCGIKGKDSALTSLPVKWSETKEIAQERERTPLVKRINEYARFPM